MTLEWTSYSRAVCPGGLVALVQGVRGNTVHGGTGSTPMLFLAVYFLLISDLCLKFVDIPVTPPLLGHMTGNVTRGHYPL